MHKIIDSITFVAAAGDPKNSVKVGYEDKNTWIIQKTLAVLYDVGVPAIQYHIKKTFEDTELVESPV